MCRVIPSNNIVENISENPDIQIMMIENKNKRILNVHEKFKQAHVQIKRLALLTLEITGNQFENN